MGQYVSISFVNWDPIAQIENETGSLPSLGEIPQEAYVVVEEFSGFVFNNYLNETWGYVAQIVREQLSDRQRKLFDTYNDVLDSSVIGGLEFGRRFKPSKWQGEEWKNAIELNDYAWRFLTPSEAKQLRLIANEIDFDQISKLVRYINPIENATDTDAELDKIDVQKPLKIFFEQTVYRFASIEDAIFATTAYLRPLEYAAENNLALLFNYQY